MDDIASIITPTGIAAVAAIRISGPNSHIIIQKISNLKEQDLIPGTFKLAWIIDWNDRSVLKVHEDHEDDENAEIGVREQCKKVDQALVLCFKAPKSFTGEDVIEIQCHGGTWLSKKILSLVLENGARLAQAGEFTERAILNKKIDLSQAEGILDLIHSRGELSSTNALKLYSGNLGKRIQELRVELLGILAELIACIDFPDEVSEYSREVFSQKIYEIIDEVQEILKSEKSGLILREGFKVALAGAPNAGKSSLLNAMLESDRAIVTDVAGTTRDVIEESINLNGLTVVFLDTAGIRESEDKVEQIGIGLSKKVIQEADLVLWLEDLSSETASAVHGDESAKILLNLKPEKLLRIGTKLDLLQAGENAEIGVREQSYGGRRVAERTSSRLRRTNDRSVLRVHEDHEDDENAEIGVPLHAHDVLISTSKDINIKKLKELIFSKANPELKKVHDINAVSINTRQADLLRQCINELKKAINAAQDNLAHDFWTIDLKAAIARLGEITGDDLNEEILDTMFSQFCIGK
ncbi:MAG: tRNA uridine-5-carboxymethylaminomethyl(34) synthesis GTPase MnmE [Proteobacteria bacterium]|nr:tRNA uridine-5-carboxymethylaminomethyl(34) synthesis GTPase MnmE [Pseudomonadota bacterium]